MFEGIKKLTELWKASKEQEKSTPAIHRHKDELEFLPASIEIIESPPSPLARITIGILVAIIPVALLWGGLSNMETEAIAEGVIIPVGKVKTIQALEIGKVKAIHVHDGQHVQEGDLLLTIDPTATEVDVHQVQDELLGSELNSQRLTVLLDAVLTGSEPHLHKLEVIGDFSAVEQLESQKQILANEYNHFQRTHHHLAKLVDQKQAAKSAVQASIIKLQKKAPVHKELEQGVLKLYEKGHASKLEWLKAKEQSIETEQQLAVEQEQLKEADANLAAATSDLASHREEFFKQHRKELKDELQKKRVGELILRKAQERDLGFYLRAPVSGTVQQLVVTTIGGVVEPAQALLKIVPDDTAFEVEAQVLNKDIGFIQEGQKVDVKIESFPYTYFGQLKGTVSHISRDAATGNEGQLTYPVRVSLKSSQLNIHGTLKSVQPGMTVTAEINTGHRSVLNYFLSPLRRYKDESLNER
ncbi:HlyD family type I secretion periplasmic adaptor subunit [Endozoicomonas sp. OPT23]|uniref:HlyD family type I secretion periplasmic adaptor subunit n=1 Tax=Endozoicomonas sp. OPT23 TaxID=2072845 RepID=UPI0018918A36|nr:HlyD family type I secretion periplasmic adaptor subunit [Endozoicomonas sp. OPT23]